MSTKDDRIRFAGILIKEGKIETIDMLYKILPKKLVAEIFGVNSSRFSNIKSNHPGNFKIHEVKSLSEALNVDMCLLVKIIDNSLQINEDELVVTRL